MLRSRLGLATSAERPSSRAARDATDRVHIERARREGTPAARAAAVDAFMPLVRSLARRYQRGEEPLEDLEQVASLGLLKAIDGFDLERGTAFASFAVPTIVGELRRHFRDKGWTIRVPRELQELSLRVNKEQEQASSELGRPPTPAELAARLDVPVERVLEAREASHAMRPVSLDRPALPDGEDDGDTLIDRFGSLELGYGRAEDAATVDDLLKRLPDRERMVVELRFNEDLTQSEIGERIGISQMHVSRLLRRALAELNTLAADSQRPRLEAAGSAQ
ncbi:MAG: SigB/SigF/SigG family RNA polymerase sigma factor [Actinomycetota bacterium]|nr:SigB/SigF/SigG family RNA polymerase sigma factor [Actinomycetota bacterium]